MTSDMTSEMTSSGGNRWRIAGWGFAAALLATPFVAMQFTREVNWTASDFVVMGVLIGGIGLAIEFLVRQSPSWAYRGAAIVAALTAFLTIWVNLAVGMIGDDNAYNLLFLAPIAAAFGGAILARFRAADMALAMLAAGLLQALVALGGMTQDPRGAIFSLCFALPWLLSAALFRAARG